MSISLRRFRSKYICIVVGIGQKYHAGLPEVIVNSGIIGYDALPSDRESFLRPHMPELDAIRGLAILAVLLYHGFYWGVDLSRFSVPTRWVLQSLWVGRLGVNLFFVLSGFLITRLLLQSRDRDDYFRRFYIRRALRILPAYLITILFLLVLAYAPWRFIVLSLLYLSNLTPLFGVAIAYPVLWSLAVEEHFYFIWPVLIRALTSRQVFLCCATILFLSPVSRLASFYLTQNNGFVSFVCNDYTWNSADGLACGAMLALWLTEFDGSRHQLKRLLTILFLVAICVMTAGSPWGIWTRQKALGAALQVVPWHLFFVCMIGWFLILGTGRLRHVVDWGVLRFLGDISYGLYLYHLLIFAGVDYFATHGVQRWVNTSTLHGLISRFAIGITAAVAVAFASRRTIEAYFLNWKGRLTKG
jgi:peptidoglycan/LPS O-acetylase OafA/YrhL